VAPEPARYEPSHENAGQQHNQRRDFEENHPIFVRWLLYRVLVGASSVPSKGCRHARKREAEIQRTRS
jgi:hypothetical protein